MFQCFHELLLVRIARGQSKGGSAMRTNQQSRYPKQPLANRVNRQSLKGFGKIEMFEPCQQVVGEENKVKIGQVGCPILARNFSHRIPLLQFSDDQLRRDSMVVELPDIEGKEREIGDKSLIGVALHREQRQLPRGFFRNGASNDDKAAGRLPGERLIHERRCLQPGTVAPVAQSPESVFQVFGQLGHNGVKEVFLLQIRQKILVEEGGIGSDEHLCDRGRQFGHAALQEWDCHRTRMGIAGQPLPFPAHSTLPLETQQRMEGWPPSLLGIESHPRFFLRAIDREHCRIQVENGGAAAHQPRPEAVVKTLKSSNAVSSEARQKSPQGTGIGICPKSRDVLEDAILLKQLHGFDSTQPQHYRVEQGQDNFSECVPNISFSLQEAGQCSAEI